MSTFLSTVTGRRSKYLSLFCFATAEYHSLGNLETIKKFLMILKAEKSSIEVLASDKGLFPVLKCSGRPHMARRQRETETENSSPHPL